MEYDLSALSSLDGYRLLTSLIVPRPIAWVSSLSESGSINVAPFSFFNMLGSDPPIVGIGISSRRDGVVKDTTANILRQREFVVSLVDEDNAEAMNITAIEFPAEVSELSEAGLTSAPSRSIQTPRIAEAKASLECRLIETVVIGNNTVVFGQVLHVFLREGETAETCHFIGRMRGGGGYTRTRDQFEMPRIPLATWRTADRQQR